LTIPCALCCPFGFAFTHWFTHASSAQSPAHERSALHAWFEVHTVSGVQHDLRRHAVHASSLACAAQTEPVPPLLVVPPLVVPLVPLVPLVPPLLPPLVIPPSSPLPPPLVPLVPLVPLEPVPVDVLLHATARIEAAASEASEARDRALAMRMG